MSVSLYRHFYRLIYIFTIAAVSREKQKGEYGGKEGAQEIRKRRSKRVQGRGEGKNGKKRKQIEE